MSDIENAELVRIDWLDIFSKSGWTDLDEARASTPVECADVGWVLIRDDERIVIFRSQNSDGSVGDIACFPIGCVVRVTPLEAIAARPPKEGA